MVFHSPVGVNGAQFEDGGGPSAVLLKLSKIPVVGKAIPDGLADADGETDGDAESDGEREGLADTEGESEGEAEGAAESAMSNAPAPLSRRLMSNAIEEFSF